jgi:hypothetical protein
MLIYPRVSARSAAQTDQGLGPTLCLDARQFGTTGNCHEGLQVSVVIEQVGRRHITVSLCRSNVRWTLRTVDTSGPRGQGIGSARSMTAPALGSGPWRNIYPQKPCARYGQTNPPSPTFTTRAARGLSLSIPRRALGHDPDGDPPVCHPQSLPSPETNRQRRICVAY